LQSVPINNDGSQSVITNSFGQIVNSFDALLR